MDWRCALRSSTSVMELFIAKNGKMRLSDGKPVAVTVFNIKMMKMKLGAVRWPLKSVRGKGGKMDINATKPTSSQRATAERS